MESNPAEPNILGTRRTNSENYKLGMISVVYLTCIPWFSDRSLGLGKQEQAGPHVVEEMRLPRYDQVWVIVAQQLAE